MKNILLFALQLSILSPGSAQKTNPAMEIYDPFEVTAMAECDKFLYIGTSRGLLRQDKTNLKFAFFTTEHSLLPSNYITSLVCLESGYTYIGTDKGILIWDNYAFFVVNRDNSTLPENHITALAMDRKQTLWVGTSRSGIVRNSGGPFKYDTPEQLKMIDNNIYSIAVDEIGALWIGFNNGEFGCYNPGTWNNYTSSKSIENLKVAGTGTFLLNTSNKGQYLYDGLEFKALKGGVSEKRITCSYFNPVYSRMVICDDTGIHTFDFDDIASPPRFKSYAEFIELMWKKFDVDLENTYGDK